MLNENISNKKAFSIIALIFVLYIGVTYALATLTPITTPATYTLIGVNVVIFALIKLNKLSVGQLCVSGFRVQHQKQYYRIITSEFTHEAPLHILCNMYSLYNVGTLLESNFGTLTLSFWYFIIALLGGFLAYIVHTKYQPMTPSIGASGVICGLVGVLLVIGILTGNIELLKWIGQSVVILLVMSFSPRIDSVGHFCGLAAGVITGFLFFLF